MIRTERVEGHPNLVRTYSDTGYKIRQIGTQDLYDSADDPIDSDRTYIETDIKIKEDDEAAIE